MFSPQHRKHLKKKLRTFVNGLQLTRQLRKRKVLRDIHSGNAPKIHFGCGPEHFDGYLNVDIAPDAESDLHVDTLSFLPDASVERIECYHVFEHFDYFEAKATLIDWLRILKEEGELVLELPNLAVCATELGKHFNDDGDDLAMMGIFSSPHLVRQYGEPMLHKWGWTPETLTDELLNCGFSRVEQRPVKQTWRLGTQFNRDMQLLATK